MALIKERIKKLEDEYTFEEIEYVYNKWKYKLSLSAGIKEEVKKRDSKDLIEFFSKMLAKKYANNESFCKEFEKPARDLYDFLNKFPYNISLKQMLEEIPKDIQNECESIGEALI